MGKIVLFYKFVPITDPETLMHWQRALASAHGLKGRILISRHGINATLGGEVSELKAYVKATKSHSLFKDTQFKWSNGSAVDFPRLSVKVRAEIVTFGVPDEIEIGEQGVIDGGKHISPREVHQLKEKYGERLVFMDGRNAYEAAIGKFKGAVVPDVRTTRDFVNELEKPAMQSLKDRPIVTYCTGGIRCEILSSLMKKRGFKDVYQIKGGIHKYGEQFKDEGLWQGKMYVFDRRMHVAFSDKAEDIGRCSSCGARTSNYENCGYKPCNRLVLLCQDCSAKGVFCSARCRRKEAVAV